MFLAQTPLWIRCLHKPLALFDAPLNLLGVRTTRLLSAVYYISEFLVTCALKYCNGNIHDLQKQ